MQGSRSSSGDLLAQGIERADTTSVDSVAQADQFCAFMRRCPPPDLPAPPPSQQADAVPLAKLWERFMTAGRHGRA